MTGAPLKMELWVPEFFALPLRRLEVEAAPETGRTYLLHRGRIVAVLRREDGPCAR